MKKLHKKGIAFTLGPMMVIALVVAFLILVGGLGFIVKIFRLLFSTPQVSPIAIGAIIFIIILIIKKSR